MAAKPLQPGDRVRLTEDGREQHRTLAFNNIGGIYLGPAMSRRLTHRKVGYIRVKLDSSAAPRQFRARDWERDVDQGGGAGGSD